MGLGQHISVGLLKSLLIVIELGEVQSSRGGIEPGSQVFHKVVIEHVKALVKKRLVYSCLLIFSLFAPSTARLECLADIDDRSPVHSGLTQ